MRILVYDGDCTLCEAASRRLVAWAGVPDARRRSHLAFEGEAFQRLLDARVHDELAVLEEASGEIRSGVAGILWWLRETRLAVLARLVDRRVLRALLVPPYRLVAYNRRVLAPPPPRPIPCACDPAPHAGYQGAFAALLGAVGLAGAMAALATAAWALDGGRGGRPQDLARLAAWAALPLGLAAVGSLRFPHGRRLAALGHRLWPFAAAAPAFALAAAAARVLPGGVGTPVAVVFLLAGVLLLGRSSVRRRRLLASWRA